MNRLHVHPENPQPRLIAQVAAALRQGGVIVYPTDSSYALGCALGDKAALDAIESMLLEGTKNRAEGRRPSMGQDMAKGRRTEIDFLNGLVVEKGREAGIPTPANEGIIAAVGNVGVDIPIVVRLEGTNVAQGKALLAQSDFDIIAADDLTDAARKVVAAAGQGR